MLDQQNRQKFLAHLAKQFGRDQFRTEVVDNYPQVNQYPETRLTELSIDERCANFIDTSIQVAGVDCQLTTVAQAKECFLQLCRKYAKENQEIIFTDDQRLYQYGLIDAAAQHYTTHIWSPEAGDESRHFAAKARIGVAFAEYGLTESGGVVLYASAKNGRSVSLLPEVSIIVVEKSKILPRVAQLAEVLHQKAQQGERMPSCINIISGPSSTADIELVKVVGVHGPVKQVYLVIDDLN